MAICEKVNPKDAELLEAGKRVLGTAIKAAEKIEQQRVLDVFFRSGEKMNSDAFPGFGMGFMPYQYEGIFGAIGWYNKTPENHPIRKEFKPGDVQKAAEILREYAVADPVKK